MSPTTENHARGINMIEKPRRIGHKPKLLCILFKGDHITHFFPTIVVVQEAQSLFDIPLSFELSSVSQIYNPYSVDSVVMSMQYLADTTLVLGSDVSLYHVVSYPIQPTIEEVVVLMQSSFDPTLLLESDKYNEVTLSMKSSINPTLFLGVMCLSTMSLAFLVMYLMNKGAFHYIRVFSLQVLGLFPLIGMIL
jgi:hypothetical protein